MISTKIHKLLGQRDVPGRFGSFGGAYVPETLVPALRELERAYCEAQEDEVFRTEFQELLLKYVGRPSLFYEATRLTEALGGARMFLKREDLNHTGAHKINNTRSLKAEGYKNS